LRAGKKAASNMANTINSEMIKKIIVRVSLR
jgi:hypothetical protein